MLETRLEKVSLYVLCMCIQWNHSNPLNADQNIVVGPDQDTCGCPKGVRNREVPHCTCIYIMYIHVNCVYNKDTYMYNVECS